MKEKCQKYMDSFFELDKGDRLPFKLTMHLLFCSECRTEVRSMTLAEKVSGKSISQSVSQNDSTVQNVMDKIEPKKKAKKVSLGNWIFAGIFMITAFFVLGIYIPEEWNAIIESGYHVLFGLAICVYCLLFVATNMDYFVKKSHFSKNLTMYS